jgi:hypothetical protein
MKKNLLRRLLVLACFAAVLGVGAPEAQAANECEGLMVCVPVAGPWVVVPTAGGVPRPVARYQVTCPRGYIVGGTDAELSHPAIDVTFSARLGSPVNPGVSTERSALFTAVFTGTRARAVTFRPHIGCIPGAGGGGRIPTAAGAVVPPGPPAVRRVRTARVPAGERMSVSVRCAGGERMVDLWHAVGFFTRQPPSAAVVESVRARRTLRSGRVTATGRATETLGGRRAVVQVGAVCGGAP